MHKAFKNILRWTGRVIAVLIIVVLLIPVALYIPAVQDFARKFAIEKVNQSTGMKIGIDYLRLKFPLRVSLEGVSVIEATGDTMLTAGSATVKVRLLPLLKSTIDVSEAQLSDAYYKMGTPDSLIYLRARIADARFDATALRLSDNSISIDYGEVNGADVTLMMLDSVAPPTNDTTTAAPWHIEATRLRLNDVTYRMQMLPVIDSLYTHIGSATLQQGLMDMSSQRINAACLSIDSVDVAYFTPSAEYLASHPAATPADTAEVADSAPWTITADSLRLQANRGLYAMRGATPVAGLDMNYIEVTNVALAVDSFYNRATSITVPIREIRATERCGLTLMAHGVFAMDSAMMYARDFNLRTFASQLTVDAAMGMGDLTTDPGLPLRLNARAEVALSDVELAMPAMTPMLRSVPRSAPLVIKADIEGTAGQLNIDTLRADMGSILHLKADGTVTDVMNPDKINGALDIDGSVASLNFMKPTLLEAELARQLNLPPMRIKGKVNYRPNLADGTLSLTTGDGRAAFQGRWNGNSEGYNATLHLNRFPVNSFMPSLGVGHVTADADIKGHGYDMLSPKSVIDAKIALKEVEYMDQTYSDISLDATLSDGTAKGLLISDNADARLNLTFDADLSPDTVMWDLRGRVSNLDLMAMQLATDTMRGTFDIQSRGIMSPKTMAIEATADIYDLRWQSGDMRMSTSSVSATLDSDSTIHATLVNGDLTAAIDAFCPLDTLTTRLTAISDTINSFVTRRNFDMASLQRVLPQMDLKLAAGNNNVVSQILNSSSMAFRHADLTFHNDSLMSLFGKVTNITSGETRVDTVNISASQHGKFLLYRLHMGNRPGTMDQFAKVNLSGYLANDKLSFLVKQYNIEGETGFSLGMNAALTDSAVTVRFVPYNPTIAYKAWTINRDNFVTYNFVTRQLNANLLMESAASSLHLYTLRQAADSLNVTDSIASSSVINRTPEEVVLNISNVQLADWLSISPFAPPMKGELSADMKFNWDDRNLTGRGIVNLNDLYYGKDRVGSFGLDLDLTTDIKGALRADAALLIDSIKVITAKGALNDSTAREPFLLDFSMIQFPLKVVNPFLPKDMAQLSGTLNGRMDITGNIARPIFCGNLTFDSTAVRVGMLGTSYTFSNTPIPVDSNIVTFSDFSIKGCNENPLTINGTVDARSLSDIALALDLNARNMQIVNSNRARGADLYGKGFIDLDAKVKGNMHLMSVDADINVLPATNVTYVVAPSVSGALTSQSTGDMVKFVQFNDSLGYVNIDSIVAEPQMAMILNANLIVSEGSTINVELPGSNNKAQVNGYGNLTYTMTPMSTDGRLTGRFTINKGYVHYTPPLMGVISELAFNFTEGSYVAFNGDMMNPTLHITAVDPVKANVTQEGQNSRLVDFDVSISVSNTLENMKVAFDMAAPEDITVQNELSSMSPDQRANAAMNMLLYREYSGPGTSATAKLSNPLYSFLETRVNNWLANSVKGVDISLGVNQYDQTTDGVTSTNTSYSYRVSKNLFNDRVKIVVGGNYNTEDNDDQNLSQNLINDVSIEYILNPNGTMYIKIFRHTGFESILEGEVTQTGVGFVYQRKLGSLRDIWHRMRRQTPVK
ncbi:MAG: translocation/assembly module TamB [Paramuribaculum sp.]|nr:translocation/assembly module TamB [Paramuribaculum sp.]